MKVPVRSGRLAALEYLTPAEVFQLRVTHDYSDTRRVPPPGVRDPSR